ncbi:MAG TPA: TIGR03013 family PEP-CTERM/XrtA system glycosyltransferase [Gammaproteobacteria bacterium]|nr:TIGR03013 family PEP-CTERM/XrtA system glycosyltransferase [Gammaproteobacteria bacterium]HPQ25695.1 TIGR03013 family PEP-CTERM/XrtA system glycosyltransferase [Gammaproteobacteria bacterium]
MMFRLFGHYVSKLYLLLGVVEFLVMFYSLLAGFYVRYAQGSLSLVDAPETLSYTAMAYATAMTISMISVGLYQRGLPFSAGLLVRVGLSFLIASVAMSVVFYTFPDLVVGRGVMTYAMLFTFAGVLGLRSLFFRLTNSDLQATKVLVLGTGRQARMIADLEPRQPGFRVVGYVHVNASETSIARERWLNHDRTLMDMVLEFEVDEIVVAPDDRRLRLPVDQILDCKMSGTMVLDLLSFFEKETSRIKLDVLHPSWIFFSDGFRLSGVAQYSKRALDLAAGVLIFLVAWPFMLLVAAAIMLESGGKGPVLFHQVRVGLNGRQFRVHKFRSMRTDAEADGVARWATKNDNRITRVGAVIRKTRLDELPQVFNVLRGEMSLVGPRPERPEFVEQLEKEIPFYAERHRVKPGLTGWAQLSYPYGATINDARNKLEFDLYYVKNASAFLDLIILLETVEVVLWGKGAH